MAQSQTTRALALARRKALSSAGKGAMTGASPQRTRTDAGTAAAPAPAAAPAKARVRYAAPPTQSGGSTRAVALARRKAMSTQGKRADTSTDRTTTGGPKARKAAAMTDAVPAAKKDGSCGCGCKERKAGEDAPVATPRRTERAAKAKLSQRRSTAQSNPTRAAALARRQARADNESPDTQSASITQAQIFAAQQEILDLYMAEPVEEYLVQLVLATRDPAAYDERLARLISYGASPRATIALDRCARARAWLQGRDYVTPEDVQSVAHDTLRHRILLSFEAEAEGLTSDDIITTLIKRVPVA